MFSLRGQNQAMPAHRLHSPLANNRITVNLLCIIESPFSHMFTAVTGSVVAPGHTPCGAPLAQCHLEDWQSLRQAGINYARGATMIIASAKKRTKASSGIIKDALRLDGVPVRMSTTDLATLDGHRGKKQRMVRGCCRTFLAFNPGLCNVQHPRGAH